LVGLWSPTPKTVHLLVAFVAPGLAPRLTHACAAVVVFVSWRWWRGGGENVAVWWSCGAQRPRRYTSLWRSWRPGWRPGLPTHVRLLSFSRCGACGEMGVRTLRFGGLVDPNAQGGTPPCGVCGAQVRAQDRPRTCGFCRFRVEALVARWG